MDGFAIISLKKIGVYLNLNRISIYGGYPKSVHLTSASVIDVYHFRIFFIGGITVEYFVMVNNRILFK